LIPVGPVPEPERSFTAPELAARLEGDGEVALFAEADALRAAVHGPEVHLRGLVEFSNHCAKNCHYCGLRAGNRGLSRYRMEEDEILESARVAKDNGCGTVVLQSGEDPGFPADRLCRVVETIKERTGLAVTLSVGEKTRDEYRRFREAGADRYLMRFETSDPVLFARVKPGSSLESRLERLGWLRELGFQVGSGALIGLPGQTTSMRVEDLLLIRRLDLDMIGVGPFLPHPETPLRDNASGNFDVTLRYLALLRLMNPQAHIPATTAMGTLHPRGRELALQRGANVVMPNVTPPQYRALYELYPGKICLFESPATCGSCIRSMLATLGRSVGTGPGSGRVAQRKVG